MANQKATGSPIKVPFFKAPIRGKGAVMPALTITEPPSSITLQNIDANGNPVTVQPTDSVIGTLASDSPLLTVAPGADTLHYSATFPAGTMTGLVNLAGAETGTISSNPVNFTSSLALTLDFPVPLPVAVDLEIILS